MIIFYLFIYFYLHEVKGLTAACMSKENVNKQKKTFEQQTKGTRKSLEIIVQRIKSS